MSSLNQNAPSRGGSSDDPGSFPDSLPDDVLDNIMALVGPGHYRYFAGTCKKFRKAFKRQYPGDTSTCGESIVGSVATVELYLSERELAGYFWSRESWNRFWRRMIAKLSARHGRLVVLNADYEIVEFLREAAKNGHVDCFEYLLNYSGHEIHYYDLLSAAENGHLPFLRHFHDKGVRVQFQGIRDAAFVWTKVLCEGAATRGHVHVLKFLHEEANFELPSDICNHAARAGHVECLDYLRGKGARFDESVLQAAAGSGQVHCLRYVFEALNEEYNGNWEDWSKKHSLKFALQASAVCESKDCLSFLVELDNQQWDAVDLLLAFRKVASACNFECLDYLLGLNHWDSSVIHDVVSDILYLRIDRGDSRLPRVGRSYPLDGSAEKCIRRLLGVNHVEWDRGAHLLDLAEYAEQNEEKRECASCLRAFLNGNLQQQQH